MGMFDHDAPSELLASNPSLYYVGSKATLYRGWSFWVNIVEALYVSLVVFFLAFGKDNTLTLVRSDYLRDLILREVLN